MDVTLAIYQKNVETLMLVMKDYRRACIDDLVRSLDGLHTATGKRFGYYVTIVDGQYHREEDSDNE